MDDSRAHRNDGIDALRGWAIAAVILLHLNIQVKFSDSSLGALLPPDWYAVVFWSGFYGVAVFFVISGYVITHSALNKWKTLPNLRIRAFYAMRFARIMPLLVALLTVLSALHWLGVPGFVINPERATLARSLFAALTFHINWLEIQVGYLPGSWDVLWSLSIEEAFYVGLPLLCLAARKEWHFVAAAACFLVISPWARVGLFPGNELGDKNHLAYMDGIAIGCFTALVARRARFSRLTSRVLLILGSCMLLFVVGFRKQVFELGLTDNGLYISLLSIGTALVLLWMHARHVQGEPTSHPALGWLSALGRRSYEIYLTHLFVVFAGVAVFNRSTRSDLAIYALYSSTLVLSYAVGHLVARYFSDPMNSWLRKRLVPR